MLLTFFPFTAKKVEGSRLSVFWTGEMPKMRWMPWTAGPTTTGSCESRWPSTRGRRTTVSTEEEDAVGIGREVGSETEGGREAGTTIVGQEAGTATVGGRRQTTATDAGVGHGRAVEVAARADPGPEIETMEVARGPK